MKQQLLFLISGLALLALSSCGGSDPEPEVAPSGLSYSPSSYTVSEGSAGQSSAPSVSGTAPITFALTGNTQTAISISNTGVISSTADLAAGTYPLNVVASNNAGSTTFNNAFRVIVTASNVPPSGLSYAGSIGVRKHESKSSDAPTLAGSAPFVFEITNAGALPSQISINSSTGVITAAKGLAHGTYKLNIKVSNSLGEVSVADAYTVVSEEVVFEGSVGVKSFIQTKCAPCHVNGGANPNWTVFGTASGNIDNIISRTNSGSMPQGGPALSQAEIDLFRQWKADGLKQQ